MLNPLQNLLIQVKPSGSDAGWLRPGQSMQLTVQGEPGNLFLLAGGVRIPLANLPQLFSGQVVDAQILKVQPAIELQLAPRSAQVPLPRELAAALAGQVKPGAASVVQQDNAGRFVQVAGSRINLPPDTPLALGQNVRVDLLQFEGRPVVRFTPPAGTGRPQPPAQPLAPTPEGPAAAVSFQARPALPQTPPLLSVPITAAPAGEAATAMALQHVVVQQDEDGLYILAGRERIAVPLDGGLRAGDPVVIQIVDEGASAVAHVWPALESAAPTVGTAVAVPELTGALARLLDSVLQVFGRDLNVERAATLLPNALPHTETAIRQLLSIFVGREEMSSDLGRLTTLVSAAGAMGGASPETVGALQSAVRQFTAVNADELQVLLRQLTESRSPEARIALALQSGQPEEAVKQLAGELRSQIASLQEDSRLNHVLRTTRQADTFRELSHRVLDRLHGTDLQNLRSLEQPYLFLNVPVPPGSGLRHAQVHFFNDGQGRRQFDRDNATIAMDLDLEQLGAMWVSLRVSRGNCVCRFNADSESAVSALRAGVPELVAGLQDAGYPNARVEVALWEGDRLEEVTRLMRRFAGLDASA
ncbi:MAG: flagellar hook-length control protein FliK [Candidatus Hydrogenedentes bacterium]|nr:flagellar hook-length control protein FliK [Candidatus Hydrogenedentota bacterium]